MSSIAVRKSSPAESTPRRISRQSSRSLLDRLNSLRGGRGGGDAGAGEATTGSTVGGGGGAGDVIAGGATGAGGTEGGEAATRGDGGEAAGSLTCASSSDRFG